MTNLTGVTVLAVAGILAAVGAGLATDTRRKAPDGTFLLGVLALAFGGLDLTAAAVWAAVAAAGRDWVKTIEATPDQSMLLWAFAGLAASLGVASAWVGLAGRGKRSGWLPRRPGDHRIPGPGDVAAGMALSAADPVDVLLLGPTQAVGWALATPFLAIGLALVLGPGWLATWAISRVVARLTQPAAA